MHPYQWYPVTVGVSFDHIFFFSIVALSFDLLAVATMSLLVSDGSGNAVMTVSTIAGASVCLPAAAVVGSSSTFLKDKERTEPIYLVLSLVVEGLGG